MATSKPTRTAGTKSKSVSVWKRIDRGFEIGSRTLELILTAAFIFAVALNFITATDRYIFKHSIIGSDEIQTFIMVWMTFAGAAAVSWRHQHLRIQGLDRIKVALRHPAVGVINV